MNEIFETALEIAVQAHKGQTDKSGVAYILHPLAVAAQLDSLELKTIAILHDTIEDTFVTADYLLEKGIPKELVDVVVLLTKPEDEEYESYLRRVKENPMGFAMMHNQNMLLTGSFKEKCRCAMQMTALSICGGFPLYIKKSNCIPATILTLPLGIVLSVRRKRQFAAMDRR